MSLPEKFIPIIPPPDITFYPDILQHLADGSEASFNWLYVNYSRRIYDYALLLTGNSAVSEDLVQEIFLKIWKKRKVLIGVKDFKAYLDTMCRNQVNSHFRKQLLEKQLQEHHKYLSQSEILFVQTPDDTAKIIFEAVERLPNQQKIVYRLKREEGWRTKKIAERMNLSPQTVKVHISKALKSVKEYVGKRLQL